jgi:hypothetical protein
MIKVPAGMLGVATEYELLIEVSGIGATVVSAAAESFLLQLAIKRQTALMVKIDFLII